jgi:hypothetical protein
MARPPVYTLPLPDSKTENWSYQAAFHALTQYTDPNGNSSTYAYVRTDNASLICFRQRIAHLSVA